MVTADVTISNNNLSYSNAATISFWAFVKDSSGFGTGLFSVIFSKRLMLSVGRKGGNLTAYCASQTAYYQSGTSDLESITTTTNMDTQMADTEKTIKNTSFGASKDKVWFHVKCAFSAEAKLQYVAMHSVDAATEVTDAGTMKLHNYVATNQIDFPFRFFNSATIIIRPGSFSTPILIKNLFVFTDYIPNIVKYEYL